MWTLIDWYPGDQALDFFLIVALGVTLLSSAAWIVAWRLPRRPATRHLVLVSALFCCLGMPLLASVFTASGWMLIAIPLLPATAAELGLDRAHVEPLRLPLPRQQPGDPPRTAIESVPIGSPRYVPNTMTDRDRREPDAALATSQRPAPTRVEAPRRRADDRAHLPSTYRAVAMLVLIAWGCGSVLLLLNFARNYWLIRRLRHASSSLSHDSLQRLLDDVGRRLGVRRLPQVVVSRRVLTPFAVGFRRPIVVFPERLLEAVSMDEMRDVLVHEVAHIRRRDHLIVLLQELARALYWPIVTIHGLIRELGQAREELCDNHVLRSRDALSYGETLLHLAELSWESRPLRASVGILHWKGALERRIAGLLDQRRSTMTGNSRWLACLVALVFIGGGTIASATRFIAAEVPGNPPQAPAARPPDSKDTAKKAEAKPKPTPKPAATRSIVIHAVGPDGKPMAGVNIERSVWTRTRKPENNRHIGRVTDERGEVRFDVPETLYIFRLWARTKGYVPLFAHWEEEDDPEENLPKEFTFRLERGTVIGGIIRDQAGQPIQGATVEVASTLDRGGRG